MNTSSTDNEAVFKIKLIQKPSKKHKGKMRWSVNSPLKERKRKRIRVQKNTSNNDDLAPITIKIPLGTLSTLQLDDGNNKNRKRKQRPSSEIDEPPKKVVKVSKRATPRTPKQPQTPKEKQNIVTRKKPMPIYKVISNIIKKLIQLDKQSIFYSEVTDAIAPGYSDVVKYPMCFTKMREKLEKRLYKTLDAVQMDIKLIFCNAMAYNPSDSVYYEEAKRMLSEAKKIVDSYKLKLAESDWGDSDPLSNNDEAIPLVFDPVDLEPPVKEKEIEEKEVFEKAEPPSTPKVRNRPSHYKKRKDSVATPKSSTASLPMDIPKPDPISQHVPIVAPEVVEPSNIIQHFIPNPGDIPVQETEPKEKQGQKVEENTFTYNMVVEKDIEEKVEEINVCNNLKMNTFPVKKSNTISNENILEEPKGGEDLSIPNYLKNDMKRFFDTLQNSPKDLPSFKLPNYNNNVIPEAIEKQLSKVEPLSSFSEENMKSLESLNEYGVDLSFLNTKQRKSLEFQNTLNYNWHLISNLCSFQKQRLGHIPSFDEQRIASTVMENLVSSCSSVLPSNVVNKKSLLQTIKYFENTLN